jgi:hypothetical protein
MNGCALMLQPLAEAFEISESFLALRRHAGQAQELRHADRHGAGRSSPLPGLREKVRVMRTFATVVLAATLACVSQSADAQVLRHLTGVVVDANEVVIGNVVGFGGKIDPVESPLPQTFVPDPGWPIVLFRVGGVTFPLRVSWLQFEGTVQMVYASNDCSGRPYALGTQEIGLYTQVAVREFYKVYRFDRSQPEGLTMRSLENDRQCHHNLPPRQVVGYRLRLLIDLAGRFTPPFQLR